ncbi:MAG: adenylate/guanylate cyclase domain-containing protein [Anaerolineae bacterium]|nr:adenylate/guanylate cyclase domain-containing protein [Anaerolineae bacterium]
MNPIARLIKKQEEEFWKQSSPEELWRRILTGQEPQLVWGRHFFKHIPTDPRCKLCNAPFQGIGAPLMRLIGKGKSKLNPRFCQSCLDVSPVGGAEIELSMVFADVRGSTALAEKMDPMEFSRLIDRFYSTATKLFIQTDGLIDRLIGDQVIVLYLPGLAGPNHAAIAIESAKELLRATGHARPEGPWIRVGAGVHTGRAFVGKVGQEGVTDFTVLGDAPNVAARLSSSAQAGEILVSEAAVAAAHIVADSLGMRTLALKGRREAMKVWVERIAPIVDSPGRATPE